MGDMADALIEQGMDELDRHTAGQCDDGGFYCPYCEQDDGGWCPKWEEDREK